MGVLASARSAAELWRYYQAGIVNALFGYALYAGLVAIGLNMYVAQVVGHVLGVVFNYFTYSRHAFRGVTGSKLRFIFAYTANYFVSLAALAAVSTVVSSAYVAGFMALVIVSLLNYFVLKRFVFVRAIQG